MAAAIGKVRLAQIALPLGEPTREEVLRATEPRREDARAEPSAPPGAPVRCACGGAFVPVLYGRPTKATERKAAAGEVVLGGCCIGPESPLRACVECRRGDGSRFGDELLGAIAEAKRRRAKACAKCGKTLPSPQLAPGEPERCDECCGSELEVPGEEGGGADPT